jgi:cell division protein FtsB
MTDVNIIIMSALAVLTAIGGAGKWLLIRIDNKQAASDSAEAEARKALEDRLNEEIKALRAELEHSHALNRLYLTRIFQLEAFIHAQPGIDLPDMQGWPPNQGNF